MPHFAHSTHWVQAPNDRTNFYTSNPLEAAALSWNCPEAPEAGEAGAATERDWESLDTDLWLCCLHSPSVSGLSACCPSPPLNLEPHGLGPFSLYTSSVPPLELPPLDFSRCGTSSWFELNQLYWTLLRCWLTTHLSLGEGGSVLAHDIPPRDTVRLKWAERMLLVVETEEGKVSGDRSSG